MKIYGDIIDGWDVSLFWIFN